MIKVENVSFKYKNSENLVLDELNFEVEDGKIIAIVGKNASGKSTIGKLISGIIKLKHGSIKIDNIDISKNQDLIRDKVGIVFQNPENQIIFNNIYDELSFALKNLNRDEIENRIDNALKQVGMLDKKSQDLYTLSLGEKQRIMIAEVLAKNSKYIILDEPTTMIDSNGKEEIYKIIKNLKEQGYTIICITNVSDEILLADKVLILNNGKIECEIAKKDLVDKYHLLNEFEIKEPTILKVMSELNKKGMNITLNEYSVEELVKGIINEKSN